MIVIGIVFLFVELKAWGFRGLEGVLFGSFFLDGYYGIYVINC